MTHRLDVDSPCLGAESSFGRLNGKAREKKPREKISGVGEVDRGIVDCANSIAPREIKSV